MKSLALLAVLSLATFGLWAQDAPQKPATAPPPPMHHGAHAGMMDMHQHMMQTQDQVTKMRASLEKMKANLSKITDPALKAHAQLDADLWEQMVQHMEGMSKMMSGHGGMGMGGMGMGMKDHPPMPDAKPAAPAEDKK